MGRLEETTMSMGAAAAAAAAAELTRQEEEEMTPYSEKDLAEGWEFKIVRSPWAEFRKPERFRAVLEEEKKGGWTLVEKFDDSRIRLKRPAGAKMTEGDFAEGYDPYRTVVVIPGDQRRLIALGVVGALFFGFLMVLALIGIH
jgi:hypothetical protein